MCVGSRQRLGEIREDWSVSEYGDFGLKFFVDIQGGSLFWREENKFDKLIFNVLLIILYILNSDLVL